MYYVQIKLAVIIIIGTAVFTLEDVERIVIIASCVTAIGLSVRDLIDIQKIIDIDVDKIIHKLVYKDYEGVIEYLTSVKSSMTERFLTVEWGDTLEFESSIRNLLTAIETIRK